jgi:hypothetical protein
MPDNASLAAAGAARKCGVLIRDYNKMRSLLLLISVMSSSNLAAAEMVRIAKEISDDQIIVERGSGEQLLLKKWTLKFSPLTMEGKQFPADVSPLWVTIYFDNDKTIKWSIEEVLRAGSGRASSTTRDEGPTIESNIKGDFEGWEGETVFVLDNGQVWQQAGFEYHYHYAFRPKVTIFSIDGVQRMRVEGVDQTIPVRRLK